MTASVSASVNVRVSVRVWDSIWLRVRGGLVGEGVSFSGFM